MHIKTMITKYEVSWEQSHCATVEFDDEGLTKEEAIDKAEEVQYMTTTTRQASFVVGYAIVAILPSALQKTIPHCSKRWQTT